MATVNAGGTGLGIGSGYFGSSEPGKDGSFITTQWITFVIPLVPLSSYRVRPISSFSIPFLFSSSTFESQSVPLYWPHVFQMYITYLLAAIFFKASDFLIGPTFSQKISSPFFAAFISVVLSIFALLISKFIRKGSAFANILVFALVLMFSFLAAGNISAKPEASLPYMYILWGAYVIYAIYSFLASPAASNPAEKNSRVGVRK